MSDANRVALRYIKEVTWGVNPAGALTAVRMTSESLSQGGATAASQELRSDRATPRGFRTEVRGDGGFNFELSYGNLDDLFEGLCMGVWPTAVDITDTDLSIDDGDNSINTAGGDFTVDGFVAGQWVKISGFTGNAANNGWARVQSVTTGKMVLAGITLVTESAGDSVRVTGTRIKGNGVTPTSFLLEKQFEDVTEFVSYPGMRVNDFNLNVAVGGPITGSMSFLGQNAVPAGATVGTGGPNAAPTNDVMNVVDHIEKVVEGGSELTGVTNFSFQIQNNLRAQSELGRLGARQIGLGSSTVTGSFEVYFDDRTLYEKRTNFTETDLGIVVQDPAGNGYAFSFPGVDFTAGDPQGPGINQDVIVPFTFQANYDATFDEMWSLTRAAA